MLVSHSATVLTFTTQWRFLHSFCFFHDVPWALTRDWCKCSIYDWTFNGHLCIWPVRRSCCPCWAEVLHTVFFNSTYFPESFIFMTEQNSIMCVYATFLLFIYWYNLKIVVICISLMAKIIEHLLKYIDNLHFSQIPLFPSPLFWCLIF